MLRYSECCHSLHHQHSPLNPLLPRIQLALPPSPPPLLPTDINPGGLYDLPPLYLLRQINCALSDPRGL